MNDCKPLIDPKELVPAGVGFALGFVLLGTFAVLAKTMNLALLAETWLLPRQ